MAHITGTHGVSGGDERLKPATRLLLDLVDEAFDRKSWHGTTLLGSIRGVRVDLASWRPAPRRPTSGSSPCTRHTGSTRCGARRSLDIQSPYFILDSSVPLSLTEARERGVRIRILTDGDVTDSRSVKSASRREYEELLEAGDQIFEFQPTMMHAEVMVVDEILSVFGTANFDNRSFELNDEVAIAVVDPALAATLTRAFEHDLKRSKAWTAAEWRQRPFHRKIREIFWSLFSEVF